MELKPAHTLTVEQLAKLFNEAFAGYIGGNVQFTAAALARFLARDAVDLDLSQVFMRDDQAIGFGYVARHGWTSRLAAFGVVPAAAGAGVGKAAMRAMIEQARARGDHDYGLEVIEQNTRAVKLYQGVGFEIVRRLVGYTAENVTGEAAELREVDVYDAARVMIEHEAPGLPWQVAGATLMRHAPPDVAYELDGATAILSNPSGAVVALRAMIVAPELRRQGRATRLLKALFAAYPEKKWVVSATCPEEIGGELLAGLGFERQAITQWQMRLGL
ncbi:MAG: GNAT family N-acetyltransferase [Chloroflexota bacterium]